MEIINFNARNSGIYYKVIVKQTQDTVLIQFARHILIKSDGYVHVSTAPIGAIEFEFLSDTPSCNAVVRYGIPNFQIVRGGKWGLNTNMMWDVYGHIYTNFLTEGEATFILKRTEAENFIGIIPTMIGALGFTLKKNQKKVIEKFTNAIVKVMKGEYATYWSGRSSDFIELYVLPFFKSIHFFTSSEQNNNK